MTEFQLASDAVHSNLWVAKELGKIPETIPLLERRGTQISPLLFDTSNHIINKKRPGDCHWPNVSYLTVSMVNLKTDSGEQSSHNCHSQSQVQHQAYSTRSNANELIPVYTLGQAYRVPQGVDKPQLYPPITFSGNARASDQPMQESPTVGETVPLVMHDAVLFGLRILAYRCSTSHAISHSRTFNR